MRSFPKTKFPLKISGRALYILCGAGFILTWSSGFVGGKMSEPFIEPLTLLLYRYIVTVPVLVVFALVTGSKWPRDPVTIFHICVTGILFHLLYLGGVYIAMAEGLPAGIAALIAGAQPLLTAVISLIFLQNKLTYIQWLGVGVGIFAVALVVDISPASNGTVSGYIWAIVGTFSITIGALYQKRFCSHVPLTSNLALQFGAALIILGILVPLTGSLEATWSGELIFSFFWLICVTSLGSYSLIYLLIQRGQAMNFASLFYFTPAATMLLAYFVFDERINQNGLAGLILAVCSIYLINNKFALKPDRKLFNRKT